MTIIIKTQGKKEIPTVVKLDKANNRLELFYYEEDGNITSFCFAEDHAIASKEYMYSLEHVTEDVATAFIAAYNIRNNGNYINVYAKRLRKWC